jgi:hypothetical protein
MKNKISTLLFITALSLPMSSWAIFEARLSYGSLASGQSFSDVCQGSCATPSNAPSVVPTFGLGLDALVSLPMIPFGFGLRTEDMKLKASGSGIDAEVKYNRTAVLVNYRLIDTVVHFGPIASVGISHSGSMNITEGGTQVVNLNPSSLSSYSVGLELLAKPLVVIPITIGAEAGYMSFKWGNVTNSVDSSTKNIDMSGSYLKVFLGMEI